MYRYLVGWVFCVAVAVSVCSPNTVISSDLEIRGHLCLLHFTVL